MKFFYVFLCCLLANLPGFQAIGQDLPVYFIPNKGQWQEPFLYKGQSSFADFYLEKSGITYVVGDSANPAKQEAYKERSTAPEQPVVLKYYAYKMSWLNANPNPEMRPAKKQNYYLNYFLGNNPGHWQSQVGVYGNVDYLNLYPGIDLHISSDEGLAKYDFIVRPGGDPEKIQLAFSGLQEIRVRKGMLMLKTSIGEITELAPYAYQYENGVLKEIPCRYRLDGNVITYDFPRGYDQTQNLTIDPTIVFATLTGSTSDNWGFSATYDNQGNLYAAGIVNGTGYPTTLGAFQTTFGGGTASSEMPCDISISKFNSTGTSLLYSTYLGGSEDEMPHSLVVDANGDLVVAGKTLSNNFPVTTNAYDTSYNGGYDIFITKFNSTGTALLASTYLGGTSDDGVNISPSFYGNQSTLKYNYGDGSRSEVIVDHSGNIYLAASSQSSNFPVTSTAFSNSLDGTQDGVFLKMDSGLTALTYSTYIGGSGTDAAYVLSLDTAETHVYVGGGTNSSSLGGSTTTGAWQNSFQGGTADGFICRFQNGGNYSLLKTTYIGTSDYDQIYGLKTDLENSVYALGQTLGSFPVSPNVYNNAGSRQFIIKMDSLLTTREVSTVFGSGIATKPNISPVAFMVDTCGNIYVSGWASPGITPGSSTTGMPITANAFQSTTDGSDFYFAVFSKNLGSLLFGSFFGSSGKPEHVDGGTSRFDPDGVVYQAICASCGSGSAFPATPGAYATQKGSNNCNLGAVKIEFNLSSVEASAAASPDSGCAPLTVNFTNNSTNAISYFWDFGDGGASTNVQPSHTFSNPGSYQVMLAAANPNSCRTNDTDYVTIHVSTDTIHANFDFTLEDTCTNPHIVIQNTSTTIPGHLLSGAVFNWDFGDGSTYAGQNPPVHPYPVPGAYNIRLIMMEPDACNNPDTIVRTLIFTQDHLTAGFDLPDTLCQGLPVTFRNTSQNATGYDWYFGDGQSGTDAHPEHIYDTPGTYHVVLVAHNPTACNQTDSMSRTITISSSPTAAFSATPFQPETNVPTTFSNQSQEATHYFWNFGDGTNSTEKDPVHQFPKTGIFNVCLTAYNAQGCYDIVCKKISAEVEPLADLPTGFSPNGDGKNDALYVRGYGIKTMDLKIFNRWGQMVFESKNQSQGWDGTYLGRPQEMDAYAYVLEITFVDGSHMRKQGNVTLLR
ncbi:MAG TPA: PKD domain-containing protein [Edaphocola sp.]|nr:PKD domain-containing protein [Edaphocola sp.]